MLEFLVMLAGCTMRVVEASSQSSIVLSCEEGLNCSWVGVEVTTTVEDVVVSTEGFVLSSKDWGYFME